jgi:predicted esterase YcpF (UPF0227 family)
MPTAKALVYIHGFNSSPRSAKAQLFAAALARDFPSVRYCIPALPAAPGAAAMHVLQRELDSLLACGLEPVLLGSSLGGYYATWLAETRGFRAVLVNPVVLPHELFAPYLGPQCNPYTGESYVLTQAHVEELAGMAVERVSRAADFLVLLQTGDETLDWRAAWAHYADCCLLRLVGGDHGFEHFEDTFPLIYRFAGLIPPP